MPRPESHELDQKLNVAFAAPPCSVDSLNDQPWPLRDVVQKLCEAAEILLHEKNYDGHGHEEIARALKVGREWSSQPCESPVPRVRL